MSWGMLEGNLSLSSHPCFRCFNFIWFFRATYNNAKDLTSDPGQGALLKVLQGHCVAPGIELNEVNCV